MNHFVIVDPRRCIGCCACMAACVETHRQAGFQAYPRLIVTYTHFGALPVQCRQCDDAACAAVCPVEAITCTDHSVQINEGLCIGCKLCALACPFGSIVPGGTPVPGLEFNLGHYTYTNNPYAPDGMVLREIDFNRSLSLLDWRVGQKTVAVKCDLCGFSAAGPACIRACPHQALSVLNAQTAADIELAQRLKAEVIEAPGAISGRVLSRAAEEESEWA